MRTHSGVFSFAVLALAAIPASAQAPTATELFEKEIRPVLAANCYGCHSSKLKSPMGRLVLDTKAGLKQGGNGGPVIVPGDPKASRLYRALTYSDTNLRMPPAGKIPDDKIAGFSKWIAAGAFDPRADPSEDSPAGAPSPAPLKGMDIQTGRKWWSFQPLTRGAEPERESIDSFIRAKLAGSKLNPSPEADRATLIRRASLDLTGLRPSPEQVQAFVNSKAPDAWETLVDSLLASRQYGERWGRYWLDVARYGEDNPTSEATNPGYRFAWRYRDWVIEAMNRDVPYDQFVKLQLAADQIPGTPREDLRALGYLGAAPSYHKDLRLSRDVIETIFTDDWDERVDAVSRGVLGLTVACARCHDHKFDPILTKDYYGLAGVFASTVAAPRPLAPVDNNVDQQFMFTAQRLFSLSYVANLMNREPGSKPEEAAKKAASYTAEMVKLRDSMAFLKDSSPPMWEYLNNLAVIPPLLAPNSAAPPAWVPGQNFPFMQSVFDAGVWLDGSDPDLTVIDVRPGKPRDMNILPHANVASPGAVAPRQFLTVLSKGDTTFQRGSGRIDLAERMFSEGGPLAARVIVNRVWAWHFGKPIVPTLSDFGTQGEKPTHPELLDDLAARFVEHGWSLKWLHRTIMLSATYRQSSKPRAEAVEVDPSNALVWRMNPRRLDIEAYRDNLLLASGDLDPTAPAFSANLDDDSNHRRTVYGTVSRGHLNTVLALYDFPEANMSAPQRDLTTSPLQQLFVMNSPFLKQRAENLLKVSDAVDPTATVRQMYERALQRKPTGGELDLALSYLRSGTLMEYAQALLASNEVIFWP